MKLPLIGLSVLSLFLTTTLPAQLLVLTETEFFNSADWSIDIDGDGIAELRGSPTAGEMFVVRDLLTEASSFPPFTNLANAVVPYSQYDRLDGEFTAAATIAIASDNWAYEGSQSNFAGLMHGTETSDLVDAVSLVGWAIERVSDFFADDTFNIYYHDFGSVVAGASINVEFSSAMTSAVPEPSTYAAIFGGIVLAGAVWRRNKPVRMNKTA